MPATLPGSVVRAIGLLPGVAPDKATAGTCAEAAQVSIHQRPSPSGLVKERSLSEWAPAAREGQVTWVLDTVTPGDPTRRSLPAGAATAP